MFIVPSNSGLPVVDQLAQEIVSKSLKIDNTVKDKIVGALYRRKAIGLEEYGIPLRVYSDKLLDWTEDWSLLQAHEELLDSLIYLQYGISYLIQIKETNSPNFRLLQKLKDRVMETLIEWAETEPGN